MSRYAKSIAALLTAVSTWGVTAAADNGVDPVEWFGLLGVVASVLAVYATPNDAPPGDRPDPRVSERGASDVAIVVAALLIAVAIVVAFGTEVR